MKKIYSILLMAVALLISTNLKAEEKTVSNPAGLKDAFETAQNGDVIVLGEDITLAYEEMPIFMFLENSTDSITLNLNGHNIQTTGTLKTDAPVNMMFGLLKGKLGVTGNGTIQTTTPSTFDLFRVMGSATPVADYTTLVIGENVTLDADQAKKGRCVHIYTNNAKRTVNGNPVLRNDIIGGSGGSGSYGFAYGVNVLVKGTLKSSIYCVQVSGVVRSSLEYDDGTTLSIIKNTADYAESSYTLHTSDTAKAPVIKIASTATLTSKPTATEAAAIYSSGYAKWVIEGTVSGNVGVYIKSGDVTINNATITSTNTQSYLAVQATTSGVDAAGSAIVIESNKTYAGNVGVTISGDSKITASKGYAIDEVVTTSATTELKALTIEGGTFEGGSDGTTQRGISISETTKDASTGADKKTTITVGGGNFDSDDSATQSFIENYISGAYTTVVTDPVTNKETIVISAGQQPSGAASTFTINNATENDSYDFSAVTLETPEQTLNNDLVLGDLIMTNTDNPVKFTIANGKTLEVNKLTMAAGNQIIVAAGAKLIVSGSTGVYAPSVDNIIIEADGTSNTYGEFYFNPAVNSNKHPNATVQMVSKAYQEGSTYHWQRFGVPAWEHMTPSQILKENAPTAYSYWDNENNEWAAINVEDFGTFEMKPFVGFELTTTNTTAGAVYSFPCALYGNVNVDLAYRSRWNYFANSYTGGMDLRDMLLQLLNDAGDKLEGGVFVHKSATNTWDGISYGDLDEHEAKQSKLDPMQAFIIYNKSSEAVNNAINYKNVVWNHRGEAKVSQSPARRATLDYDKAKVIISADGVAQSITLRQAESFSDAYDRGYDLTKFMQGSFNIYAETENGNLEQVATDNLVGKTITVNTNSVKSFKMTFENLNGETFAIRDNVTGSVIDMTENAEYYFTADAYNGENRFEIVEARKMPTDVEVVDAAKAQKGIYTLVGAYLGEDLDVLPAGIYVVNGVKVVK